MDGITWEQFLCDIKIIYDISQQLNDNWRIVCAHDDVAGTYLVKTNTISLNIDNVSEQMNETNSPRQDFDEDNRLSFESSSEAPTSPTKAEQLIKFEYHVLYHISYAVPYLCFNAYKSNGSLLTLDEAWTIFNERSASTLNPIQEKMMNILTQMEHPVLFKPFLTLHPCRIAEVLHSLPNSQNKVLSFLSIYGSTVYLTFDLKYAKYLNESKTK